MSDEFKKLDTFMKEHRPSAMALKPVLRPKTKKPFLYAAVPALVVLIVSVTSIQVMKQNSLNEEALAITETLDWNLELDSESEEITDFVAMLD